MDDEPYQQVIISVLDFTVNPFTLNLGITLTVIVILLVISAFISGSEASYFSLSPSEISSFRGSHNRRNKIVVKLIDMPERLLATILVANNFVNLGIIIISTYFTTSLFDYTQSEVLGFIIEVLAITTLIVVFGEILPKIYAIRYAMKFAEFMAIPLDVLEKIFRPLNLLLINSTSFIHKRLASRRMNISMNDLSEALDLTREGITEEKKILKGIVRFGNIDVKEIMTSRVDVLGVSIKTRLKPLIGTIVDSGFSRIPVYHQDLDHINGILYVKDLLPHLGKPDSFNWQSLIRPPYYVPETKKISELLKEFQTTKIHMAVVVDEYGGTSGIITLEDILEEIVGEITDESDEDQLHFVKIDEDNYLFEAKILLHDFCKILNLDEEIFSNVKGEAETLAGLILEMKNELPKKNEIFNVKDFQFTIKSVDERRIKQVLVTFKSGNIE
ncbi:MAG: gliding motility-associated protein GldE [Bacteroidales bacterium]|nr:gliding motility-associated protein GldE [Bacteroidales bacterium]